VLNKDHISICGHRPAAVSLRASPSGVSMRAVAAKLKAKISESPSSVTHRGQLAFLFSPVYTGSSVCRVSIIAQTVSISIC
jgi:hypothetical protein